MRILAFSDIHRDTKLTQRICEASSEADVVVEASDFAIRGQGADDTLSILQKL